MIEQQNRDERKHNKEAPTHQPQGFHCLSWAILLPVLLISTGWF